MKFRLWTLLPLLSLAVGCGAPHLDESRASEGSVSEVPQEKFWGPPAPEPPLMPSLTPEVPQAPAAPMSPGDGRKADTTATPAMPDSATPK